MFTYTWALETSTSRFKFPCTEWLWIIIIIILWWVEKTPNARVFEDQRPWGGARITLIGRRSQNFYATFSTTPIRVSYINCQLVLSCYWNHCIIMTYVKWWVMRVGVILETAESGGNYMSFELGLRCIRPCHAVLRTTWQDKSSNRERPANSQHVHNTA